MAPQQKGKQATKGAKQIVEDNKSTLAFYRNMAIGSFASSICITLLFFEVTKITVIMLILSLAVLGATYQFMNFMARAKYAEAGVLLDSGSDLNMEGSIAENVKDVIILTSATLLLALMSNYFWFLLLLAPVRASYMLWGSVIKPWLGQRNSDAEPELDEKKQRKMDRKMRRMR